METPIPNKWLKLYMAHTHIVVKIIYGNNPIPYKWLKSYMEKDYRMNHHIYNWVFISRVVIVKYNHIEVKTTRVCPARDSHFL